MNMKTLMMNTILCRMMPFLHDEKFPANFVPVKLLLCNQTGGCYAGIEAFVM